MHAENCGWTVRWSDKINTLCPTKMYGAHSTDRTTGSVYSVFCTCHASMTITTCVYTRVRTHTHTHTHTHTRTHAHYILTYAHTLTCTHKHTGMNKKLEDNLFAHCVSLVLFNIMSFCLIMLLQGTCCSWEFIWHILVCRFSCFHYVAFYRHSEVYYLTENWICPSFYKGVLGRVLLEITSSLRPILCNRPEE